MFSDKNKLVLPALISFLIIGLIAGYLAGRNKNLNTVPGEIGNGAEGKIGSKITSGLVNLTAKEARDLALANAKVLPADSYLSGLELSLGKLNKSGLSNGWKLSFYSKSKNKVYDLWVKNGEIRGDVAEKDVSKSLQTLKGEMVDSSVLAQSFFSIYPENTDIISLKMYYDAGSKKFLWTVFFPKGSHTIDAEI